MRFNLFLIPIFGVTLSTLMFPSLFFISCGAFEDDNSEPSIGGITDKTLNVGAETTVEVNITDTDFRDTHSIRASSDDTAIATVSVNDTTLTISTIAEGVTTITVSAADDSGLDNATATPVTFQVTVEPFVDKGVCAVGMVLEPGESCTYFAGATEVVFSVNADLGCRESRAVDKAKCLKLCVSPRIERDDLFNSNFSADKNQNGSWRIKRVP